MGGTDGNASFEERLLAARRKRGLQPPAAVTPLEAQPAQAGAGEWGVAMRVGTDMVAALAVGVAIGWALDHWLGTSPAFLIVFVLLGGAAGLRSVWRLVSPRG